MGPTGLLDGRIAEIRIYDGALDTATRQGTEAELTGKHFNPVPEPTTFAAVGFGVLGPTKRRRKA